MASALDLAGVLRGLAPDVLGARLRERTLARVSAINDAFDLADALLEATSIRQALTRLDRFSLLLLQEGREPGEASALLEQASPSFDVPRAVAERSAQRVTDLFLALPLPGGRLVTLDQVADHFDENDGFDAGRLADERPPAVLEAVDPVDRGSLDAQSAERLYAIVVEVAEIVRAAAVTPARELAKGGLALPETRRLADAAHVDVDDVAPLVTVARAAALLELGPDGWVPTAEADAWLLSPWSSRWATLVSAWLSSLPREILTVLDDRAETSWGEPLQAFTEWLFPAGASWIPERLESFARSAELFGLTSGRRPTSVAIALLREGMPAAREIVDGLMPEPIDKVYLQHDLTVVAPGPLAPDLDGRLRGIAVVESAGLAATYRISEDGIERALSSGETAETLREFLESISSTGIPQPVGYLLSETASRHGRYLVGNLAQGSSTAGIDDAAVTFGAVSQIRCDDPALVDTLAVDQALSPLGLRRVDPLRMLCRFDAESVYWALRDERYPVMLEDAEARPMRSPVRRRSKRAAPAVTTDPVGELVTRLAESSDDTEEDTERAWILRQLDAAVKARLTVQLRVAQPDGSTIELQMEPTGVGGGRLRGRDRKSDIERTLPVSSIVAVSTPDA